MTGVVETNPKISDAKVSVYKNGELIDSDVTNENGEYTVDTSDDDSCIVVSVEGYDSSELDHTFYAGASKEVNGNTTNFNFTNRKQLTIDGETVLVSNDVESGNDVVHIANVYQLQSIMG